MGGEGGRLQEVEEGEELLHTVLEGCPCQEDTVLLGGGREGERERGEGGRERGRREGGREGGRGWMDGVEGD